VIKKDIEFQKATQSKQALTTPRQPSTIQGEGHGAGLPGFRSARALSCCRATPCRVSSTSRGYGRLDLFYCSTVGRDAQLKGIILQKK
jgi:hypothetical protein